MYMNGKKTLGGVGEEFAANYLRKKGYRIIERNHRNKCGEIDIIARSKDRAIIFVEVKTMESFKGGNGLVPEDQLTRAKLKKFQKAAMLYIGSHKKLMDEERGMRLDVIAIVKREKNFLVRHYENVLEIWRY